MKIDRLLVERGKQAYRTNPPNTMVQLIDHLHKNAISMMFVIDTLESESVVISLKSVNGEHTQY